MTGALYAPPRTDAPDNLLVNSHFIKPYLINQRGRTSYTISGQPTIDRWVLVGSGTLNVFDGYISLGKNSGEDVDLQQNLENYDRMKGQTYTIGVGNINGRTYAAPFTMGQVADGIALGGCKFFSVDSRNILFSVTKSDGWLWAALYEGAYTPDNFPPPTPRPHSVELAECQRDYYQTWDGPTPATTAGIVTCEAITDARLGGNIALPVQMRSTPTITFYNSSGEVGTWKEWVSGTRVSVSAVYNNSKSFMVGADKAVKGLFYAGHYCASCEPWDL